MPEIPHPVGQFFLSVQRSKQILFMVTGTAA